MINVEILGDLIYSDSNIKIQVQVIDKTDNYNSVLKVYNRKYKGDSNARSVLNSISDLMIQKGYEIYNIKGFGY
jgi:hypothetical protein